MDLHFLAFLPTPLEDFVLIKGRSYYSVMHEIKFDEEDSECSLEMSNFNFADNVFSSRKLLFGIVADE